MFKCFFFFGFSESRRSKLLREKIAAFTLIELSIVLVVIGLIVSGIVAGQSVTKGARLRAVASDITRYTVAVNNFRLQYDAYPGDLVNATSYWSTAATGCSAPGNQLMDDQGCIWNQLSLAGIIPGKYTSAGVSIPPVANTEVPAAPIPGGRWVIWRHTGGQEMYGRPGSSLNLNAGPNTGAGWADTFSASLSTVDSIALDMKVDDGKANKGNMYAVKPFGISTDGYCTLTTGTYYTVGGIDYNYADTINAPRCWLIFFLTQN